MVLLAVPEVLAAFLALLFLVATEPIWYPALLNAIEALPGVVQPVVTTVLNGIKSAIDSIAHWVDSTAAPAVIALWGLWWVSWQRVTSTPVALNAAWQALQRVQFNVLPAALSNLQHWTQQALTALWSSTVGLVAQVQAYSQQLFHQAEADAGAATAALASETQQALTALWQADVGLAEKVLSQTEADITAARAEAQSLALAAVVTAEGYAQSVERLLVADLDTLRNQVEGGIQALDQSLRGLIGGVDQDLLGRIRAVGLAATAGLALAEGEISQIKDSECMRYCSPLGGLGQALTLIDLAAIVALVAEAYHDPGAATALVKDVLSPLASEGEQLLKEITAA